MLIGNVIFHAFEAASLFLMMLAPVVVAVEAAILRAFHKGARLRVIVTCAIGMNLASYLVGFWAAPRLYVRSGLVVVDPDEHGYGILNRGPDWRRQARLSFLQAGVVSVVVEAAALWPLRRRAGLRWVLAPVVLGNAISYALLAWMFVAAFGG